MRATSNRKLAEALGVSETAVRKALAAGRISREADGGFDVAAALGQAAGGRHFLSASGPSLGEETRHPAGRQGRRESQPQGRL
jgi:hypothetical protein